MVLLTVYYMVATGVQSWRLRTIYQKISHVINTKNSLVFLKNSDGSSDGEKYLTFELFFRMLNNNRFSKLPGVRTALAASDLCVNSAEALVGDCFWSNEVSQGISVSPKQLVFLNPFISFPRPTGMLPFNFDADKELEADDVEAIYALIESDLNPLFNDPATLEVICSSVGLRHMESNANTVCDSLICDPIRYCYHTGINA